MPLVTCPDCQKQVSDAAPACIYCGRPNPAAGATHTSALAPRTQTCPSCHALVDAPAATDGATAVCLECGEVLQTRIRPARSRKWLVALGGAALVAGLVTQHGVGDPCATLREELVARMLPPSGMELRIERDFGVPPVGRMIAEDMANMQVDGLSRRQCVAGLKRLHRHHHGW